MKYVVKALIAAGGAAVALACSSSARKVEAAPAPAIYASRIVPVKGSDTSPAEDAIEVALPHVVSWTNANIFAHLASSDSLEIQLSQQGASRAQNHAVRDFANQMIAEHSTHLQTGKQFALQAEITPSSAPDDTADAALAGRVLNRLANFTAGDLTASSPDNVASNGNNANSPQRDTYDRRFMRAEVVMHEHMLSDLLTLRSQASGPAAQLIDQTIPVVREHLSEAQKVWQQVGGRRSSVLAPK